MLVVPINEAEAIIEPFWDGGSSEHPTDKAGVLDEYSIHTAASARAKVEQSWCSAVVSIDHAKPGTVAVTMTRQCDINLQGYDVFRVFASLPRWVFMRARATIDGKECVVIEHAQGGNTHDELDGPVHGSHMTRLSLEFGLLENAPAYIELLWLGLSNSPKQLLMEARQSPYTKAWRSLLAETPAEAHPQIGIFFNDRELVSLRRKIGKGHMRQVFERMRQQAQEDMRKCADPEADVGYYVPNPDRRWCRNRDMQRKRTAGIMERLAFVGLVDGNHDMSQLAARMALSAAHCDVWCESIMGVFPGATWHHRSFTEEVYCRACALVLDWAGFCLTPHGTQVIRDAIIMKGLPRIESDFKRMEYIRHMNQGIVFSSGRIIGLLGVLPAYPRYAGVIDEAECDLREMIDAYVQPDGGTMEGMAYWNYTFGTVMPLFYALARYHGFADLREYAARGGLPASLVKTGDYALAMMSTTGDGTTYLPINDAHTDEHIDRALIAAYCQISKRPEWKGLYAAAETSSAGGNDLYDIIFTPARTMKQTIVAAPRTDVLPNVGEVSSVRRHPQLGLVHFHLSAGPILLTHYHMDRGSFVLEANHEALAIDRGVTTYDHPEVGLIGSAARHNLLYPESPDGRIIDQPPDAKGATLTSALVADGILMLACDTTLAWEMGIYQLIQRRVFSPAPELYVIDDEARMMTPMPVSFRLNTRGRIEQRNKEFWIEGANACLRLIPLNWTPDHFVAGPEGIDSHLKPVNLLRLVTPTGGTHRLLTAIEVVIAGASAGDWQVREDPAFSLVKGTKSVKVSIGRRPQLRVEVTSRKRAILTARYLNNQWELGA